MGFPSFLSAAPRSFTWLGKWSQPMMARLTSEIIIENETQIVATDQDLEIHTKIISERWNLACTLQNWISFQWSRAPQSWCIDKHSCFHRFYAKRIILCPLWPGFVPKFVRPPTIPPGGQVVTSTPGELLREHIGFWILPCKWFLTPFRQSSWAINFGFWWHSSSQKYIIHYIKIVIRHDIREVLITSPFRAYFVIHPCGWGWIINLGAP